MGLFDWGCKRLVLTDGILNEITESSIVDLCEEFGPDQKESLFEIPGAKPYSFLKGKTLYNFTGSRYTLSQDLYNLLTDKKLLKSKYIVMPYTLFGQESDDQGNWEMGLVIPAFLQDTTYTPEVFAQGVDIAQKIEELREFFLQLKKVVTEMDKLGLSTSNLDFSDFSIKSGRFKDKVVFSNFTKLKNKVSEEDVDTNVCGIIRKCFEYFSNGSVDRNTMYMLFGKNAVNMIFSATDNVSASEVIESIVSCKDDVECKDCGAHFDSSVFSFCPHCYNVIDSDEIQNTKTQDDYDFYIKIPNELNLSTLYLDAIDSFFHKICNGYIRDFSILFDYDNCQIEGIRLNIIGDYASFDVHGIINSNKFIKLRDILLVLTKEHLDIGEYNTNLFISREEFYLNDIRISDFKIVDDSKNNSLESLTRYILEYLRNNTSFMMFGNNQFKYLGHNDIFEHGYQAVKDFEKFILTGELDLSSILFKWRFDDERTVDLSKFEYEFANSLEYISPDPTFVSSDGSYLEYDVKVSGSDLVYTYKKIKPVTFRGFLKMYPLYTTLYHNFPSYRVVLLNDEVDSYGDFVMAGFLVRKSEYTKLTDIGSSSRFTNKDNILVAINFIKFIAKIPCGNRFIANASYFLGPVGYEDLGLCIDKNLNVVCTNFARSSFLKTGNFSVNIGIVEQFGHMEFVKEINNATRRLGIKQDLALGKKDASRIIEFLFDRYNSMDGYCAEHNRFYVSSHSACSMCHPNTIFLPKNEIVNSCGALDFNARYEIYYNSINLYDRYNLSGNNYNLYYLFRLKEDRDQDSEAIKQIEALASNNVPENGAHDDTNNICLIRDCLSKEIVGYATKANFYFSGDIEVEEVWQLREKTKYAFLRKAVDYFAKNSDLYSCDIDSLDSFIKVIIVNNQYYGFFIKDLLLFRNVSGSHLTEEKIYDLFHDWIKDDNTFTYEEKNGDIVGNGLDFFINFSDNILNRSLNYCEVHDMYYDNGSLCPICFKYFSGKTKLYDSHSGIEPFKDGAEANIYPTSDDRYVEKIYNKYTKGKGRSPSRVLTVDLDRKTKILSKLMDKASTVNFYHEEEGFAVFVPEYVSIDKDTETVCGYWMRKLPENSRPFIDLTDASVIAKNGYTDKFILKLLTNFGKALEFLHANNMYIGDVSGTNVFFDENGIVYIIDVDSNGVDELKSVMYTPVFADPLAFNKDNTLNTSPLTDWYAYAIISFMCLLRAHPFKGVYFTYDESSNKRLMSTEDRMKYKISLLNPEHDVKAPSVMRPLTSITPQLYSAFLRIFESDERFSILPYIEAEYNGGGKVIDSVSKPKPKVKVAKTIKSNEEKNAPTKESGSFLITEVEFSKIRRDLEWQKEMELSWLRIRRPSNNFLLVAYNTKNCKYIIYDGMELNCIVTDALEIIVDHVKLPSSCRSKMLCFYGDNVYYPNDGYLYTFNVSTGKRAKFLCDVADNESRLYVIEKNFYLVSGTKAYKLSPKKA